MPRISVITSVYNTKAEYLQDYIDSIMGQTYQNYEVVIVDDGSTSPETIEFLKEIQRKYKEKVSVYFQKCNHGIAASRNYALDRAKGEYVCIIDSDDYYAADFLEKMAQPVEMGADIDMVVCSGYTCVDEKKNFLKKNSYKGKKIDDFFYFQMPTGTRLIKRKILVDNHINFPLNTIYEDNTFCIAATLYSREIVHVDSYGYINRQHKASYSHGSLYKTITLDQIPYSYIEKRVYAGEILNTVTPEKRMAVQGAVMIIAATCACFFCRRSTKQQIRDIVRYSSKFIKKNIKNSNACMYLWCKNAVHGFPERVLNVGYGLAVSLHCERIYIYMIHKILNLIDE